LSLFKPHLQIPRKSQPPTKVPIQIHSLLFKAAPKSSKKEARILENEKSQIPNPLVTLITIEMNIIIQSS
jgi:hypothetical protein